MNYYLSLTCKLHKANNQKNYTFGHFNILPFCYRKSDDWKSIRWKNVLKILSLNPVLFLKFSEKKNLHCMTPPHINVYHLVPTLYQSYHEYIQIQNATFLWLHHLSFSGQSSCPLHQFIPFFFLFLFLPNFSIWCLNTWCGGGQELIT